MKETSNAKTHAHLATKRMVKPPDAFPVPARIGCFPRFQDPGTRSFCVLQGKGAQGMHANQTIE